MRGLKATVLALAAITAGGAEQAGAALTLGETFEPIPCGPNTTYIQTVDPGDRYMVPFDGVITSWSYQAGEVDPATVVQLKIASPIPGTNFNQSPTNLAIVAQSSREIPVAGEVNSYDTRIPVKTGYRIGEYVSGGSSHCSRSVVGNLYFDHYVEADVLPGTTTLFTRESYQQDISAVLEADGDRDGFGDETQDQCPGSAAFQLPPCDRTAPETTITKGAPNKTAKSKVKFKFISNEVGGTYECKLDRRPFRLCTSPSTVKRLGDGKHKFKVRATDATGNVDLTPAKDRFKVAN